ncbi:MULTISPECIES: FAD-binding oxidoreductase [unclassified Pseudonocardia]|uniref:FAD-binding oxidoreductase n=1 Tax=unclassified Pseudonocardia TaxID=2619320 RepID=UPI0007616252|nr:MULTISPECIES: FAD-dependent oxidoreductase [unclassified Pseudonocardia]
MEQPLSCVSPDDTRYEQLARRGFSRRVGAPEHFYLPDTAEQVSEVVGRSFRGQRRLAIRGGGHCAEGFVDVPEIGVVVDLARMRSVAFDSELSAFSVDGGATLEDVNRELFLGWGVTLPAGWCPTVGVGGHVTAGGYGVLSRSLGLVVDYLYAVEVVTVNADGHPEIILATSELFDPNRDLWWALTGGGSSFGVVTRYLFRDRNATGTSPEQLLPQAPSRMLQFSCEWPWDGIDEPRFIRLVRNHAEWCSRNAISTHSNSRVYSDLILNTRNLGCHRMIGQIHGPDAGSLLESLIAEMSNGIGAPAHVHRNWLPFLTSTRGGQDSGGNHSRFKLKSGYRSEALDDHQVRIIYRYLARSPYSGFHGSVSQKSYGGRINDTPPHATATATRDATMLITYVAEWDEASDDEANDGWVRRLYGDVYRHSGGVPRASDGAYIGYADKDLADPSLNHGAPWHQLYFKHNFPRLQDVKRRYDLHDFFRHGLSVPRLA